jgi:hypothetical protein
LWNIPYKKKRSKQTVFFAFLARAFSNFLQKKKKKRQANKKTDRVEKKRKKKNSNFIISAATCVRQREKVQRTISRLLLNMKKKIRPCYFKYCLAYCNIFLFCFVVFAFFSSFRAVPEAKARPAKFRTNTRMISDATRDDFFLFSLPSSSRPVPRHRRECGCKKATVSKQQSKYICIITLRAGEATTRRIFLLLFVDLLGLLKFI